MLSNPAVLQSFTTIDLVTILDSLKDYCAAYTYDPSFFKLMFARIEKGLKKMPVKNQVKLIMATLTACKRMRYNDPKVMRWLCNAALNVFDHMPQTLDQKYWTHVLWTFAHYPHYDLWRSILARFDIDQMRHVSFNSNLLVLHSLMLVEHYDHALCQKLLTNMLRGSEQGEDFKGRRNQVDQVVSYYAFDVCKRAPAEVREFALQCHR